MVTIRRERRTVFIGYVYKNTRFKYSTGVSIDDVWWKDNQIRASHPDYETLYQQIEDKRTQVNAAVRRVIARGMEPFASVVRQELSIDELGVDFRFFADYDRWIALKEATRADGYVKNLKLNKSYMEKFEAFLGMRLDRYTFNSSIFDRWVLWMASVEDKSDQTIYTHARILKRFLKYAYPDGGFQYVKYDNLVVEDIVYLYEIELMGLIDADLPYRGFMDKVRDLFVFCCLTGMRYSDSQLYDPTWIENGVFDFRQKKTGTRATPPLFDKAKAILDKWEGTTPKISQQKYNDHLKDLFRHLELDRPVTTSYYKGGKLQKSISPLSEVISSHVARKTFIMTCLLKEISIQDVMWMSGHTEYNSFRAYITVSKQHIKNVSSKWSI